MEKLKNTFQTNLYTYLHIREKTVYIHAAKKKKSKFFELFINQVPLSYFSQIENEQTQESYKGHTIFNRKWNINLEF